MRQGLKIQGEEDHIRRYVGRAQVRSYNSSIFRVSSFESGLFSLPKVFHKPHLHRHKIKQSRELTKRVRAEDRAEDREDHDTLKSQTVCSSTHMVHLPLPFRSSHLHYKNAEASHKLEDVYYSDVISQTNRIPCRHQTLPSPPPSPQQQPPQQQHRQQRHHQ